ncbi:MAG: arylsulfatase [Planctomycetes bacterium]|nr:arylsulfatase [Planctomycetota bacterium]
MLPRLRILVTRSATWLASCLLLVGAPAAAQEVPRAPAKPNVLLIVADDLGWGDVGGYGGERCKIPTPNLDRLASQGLRFTDAHAAAAICAPSRYALLTGRYAWRTRLRAGNVESWGKPLIAADRLTLAELARRQGYRTACIGKWHLGWDWRIPAGKEPFFRGRGGAQDEARLAVWREVFGRAIGGGPTTRGFDEYFGVDIPNHPPFCFLENDRTVGVPTVPLPDSQLGENLASVGGPAIDGWKLEGVLPALGDRATRFLAASKGRKEPFFLYLASTAPHTPYAVNEPWRGKSGLGAYADLVMETDAWVGRVLAALDEAGLADSTLVIFSSDNGCAPVAGIDALQAQGHFPSGPWRGRKQDAWEGGHRVPLIVRWPGVVAPGTTSARLVGLVDVFATFASILGAELPASVAEDSVSLLPILRGEDVAVREALVSQSGSGVLALRSGKWKAIFGPGSGAPDGSGPSLFDLEVDPSETRDLAAASVDEVQRLTRELQRLIDLGRSTPGEPQKNDVSVELRQSKTPKGK